MAENKQNSDPRAAFGTHRNPLEKKSESEQIAEARENLEKNFSRNRLKEKGDAGEDARQTKPL
jgi:hypothetical protein